MTDVIQENLAKLKLHYLAENLDDFLIHAQKKSMTPLEIIDRFSELELVEKSKRRVEHRIKAARIGKFKPMNQFDWDWPKEIDRHTIESLLKLDFIKTQHNIFFAGAQGLGKTEIARNIAWNAATKGYSVLFTTASKLIMDLSSMDGTAALERRLKRYEKPDLLVIDEIGYLSFDHKSADLIFEIVNRRYEKGSIVMTTNLAFRDWHQIFPGAPCVTAMIDRLTHHCHIIKLAGPSYRSKEAKEQRS